MVTCKRMNSILTSFHVQKSTQNRFKKLKTTIKLEENRAETLISLYLAVESYILH